MNEFITYAQNAEDVMLWRALKDIQRGFYIDVGAQDPVIDSVTKAFYERGWRGINIEPVQHWYVKLVQDRPHDINLRVAASNYEGKMTLFEVEGTGLSTSNSKIAQRHRNGGWAVQERTVLCKTLEDICTEHQVGTVHFLKIDCEGSEEQTLAGISLAAVRPWIILVEATEPLLVKPTWRKWEHWLTDRGYKFVYFDGLNRFYLAEERLKLRNAFRTPPNPLDWTRRAAEARAQESIAGLSTQLAQFRLVERGARAEAERDHLRSENERHGAELASLRGESERRETEVNRLLAANNELQGVLHARDVQFDDVAAERDRLRSENGHRDAEIELLRTAECELRTVLRAREVQITKIAREHDRLCEENEHYEVELTRLRVACLESETRINALLVSRSWRITAPLRLCGRGARWFLHALLMVACITLRPFAHMARPTLRWLASQRLIRRMVTCTFGKRSRLVNTARLFLFGGAQSPTEIIEVASDNVCASQARDSDSITRGVKQAEAVASVELLSERGRVVRRLMDEIHTRAHEEGEHAHRP